MNYMLFIYGALATLIGFPNLVMAPSANTTPEFYRNLQGNWGGTYKLWLRPGAPVRESKISAQFQPTAKDHYFLMTYTWKYDDITHEGIFLLGGKGKNASACWGDSFHSTPELMQCKGHLEGNGVKLVFRGIYAAGAGPPWGWRTEFTLQGPNILLMEAYNITPDGQEGLAVRAEMKRSPGKLKKKNVSHGGM